MTSANERKPIEVEIHFKDDGTIGAITHPDGKVYAPILSKTLHFIEVLPDSAKYEEFEKARDEFIKDQLMKAYGDTPEQNYNAKCDLEIAANWAHARAQAEIEKLRHEKCDQMDAKHALSVKAEEEIESIKSQVKVLEDALKLYKENVDINGKFTAKEALEQLEKMGGWEMKNRDYTLTLLLAMLGFILSFLLTVVLYWSKC